MPWKERSVVEERMRFVLRLKDGESMASLCREFGISRVTGYKIYDRYKECGLEGLTDRARTPYRYANKLPTQLEAMIVSMRREKPTWGARKLRERLLRKLPNDVRVPACSTIHAIMDRHGLVTRPEEIRFDLCAKIRHRRVFDGREIAVSCVVDNNLQRAKGADRRLHCARCRGLVGHVQREELDLVTAALR